MTVHENDTVTNKKQPVTKMTFCNITKYYYIQNEIGIEYLPKLEIIKYYNLHIYS